MKKQILMMTLTLVGLGIGGQLFGCKSSPQCEAFCAAKGYTPDDPKVNLKNLCGAKRIPIAEICGGLKCVGGGRCERECMVCCGRAG